MLRVHAAFLRAINVAGHAVLKMEDLKQAFEEAGCREVRTVIQSGNVLFTAPDRGLEAMKRRIGNNLAALVGETPAIIYRTGEEIRVLAQSEPFGGMASGPDTKHYVAFMTKPPMNLPTLPLADLKEGLEVLGMTGLDVFIISRRVKGRFGFPNNLIENAFGIEASTRNWNTVLKIAGLAGG